MAALRGQVLWPLLLNIFQNDLNSVDTGLTMYADDHQIYEIAGKEVVSQLQQNATLTTNWYDSNIL